MADRKDYQACATLKLKFTVFAEGNSRAVEQATALLQHLMTVCQQALTEELHSEIYNPQFEPNAVITFDPPEPT